MATINSNIVHNAQSIIDSIGSGVKIKKVKKDNGLLERSENNDKIILAEDNRQVLFG